MFQTFQGFSYPIPSFKQMHVLEYGPGLSTANRFEEEIQHIAATGEYCMIDISPVVVTTLRWIARHYELTEEQVPLSDKGIAKGSQELINQGRNGTYDLVISSAVHSAGRDDFKTSIINAHALLKKNGMFVMRCGQTDDQQPLTIRQIRLFTEKIFKSNSEKMMIRKEKHPMNGKPLDILEIVFKKR